MAVNFDHITTQQNTGTSISATHTLGTRGNRVLFAAVVSNTDPALPKYGGAGGADFTAIYNSGRYAAGYYIVPAGDSGAKSIYSSYASSDAGMIVAEYYDVAVIPSGSAGVATNSYPNTIVPQATSLAIGAIVASLCVNYSSTGSSGLTPSETSRSGLITVNIGVWCSDTTATGTTQNMTWTAAGGYGNGMAFAIGFEQLLGGEPVSVTPYMMA